MPRGNGTGPKGQGPETGKGMEDSGQKRGGRGGGFAAGPDGYCLCPKCAERVPHQLGTPCYKVKCPKCGTLMIRE